MPGSMRRCAQTGTSWVGPVSGVVVGVGLWLAALLVPSQPVMAQFWNEPQFGSSQDDPPFLRHGQPRVKARSTREFDTACSFPWSYSRGLHRCVCMRAGYSLQQGGCAPDGASAACGDTERWSPRQGVCVCARGLHRDGAACVVDADVTASVSPTDGEPGAVGAASTDPRAQATARVQTCFQELGLYKGPIDGLANKETWTAYWNFKHDNGLAAYSDFLAEPVQQKLQSLCKPPEQVAALVPPSPSGAEPSEGGEAVVPAPQPAPPRTELDIDCLPADLIALLHRNHGGAVKACGEICLPAPKGLDKTELDALAARNGLKWCEACVPIEGHLALEDVRRIERAGNVQLCAVPPKQVPRNAGVAADDKSYTRIREFYRSLPPAMSDETGVALIIGNHSYAGLPPSETARNDAGAIYSFLSEHLGYAQDNIIDVRDAKKADLERLLGADQGSDGELARLVHAHPGANVVVYYSGLGATDAAQSETYLVPVDAERYREERSGYPLSRLYANLQKLGAKSVLVLLETEFGREQGPYVLPPNVPETTRSALPPAPQPALTVLVAADRGQRRLIDVTYGIGLFTRYLIEGLSGSADLEPVGNGDGKVDSAEAYVYTALMVELAARKTFGLLQNPVYSSAVTPVLASGGKTGAAKP